MDREAILEVLRSTTYGSRQFPLTDELLLALAHLGAQYDYAGEEDWGFGLLRAVQELLWSLDTGPHKPPKGNYPVDTHFYRGVKVQDYAEVHRLQVEHGAEEVRYFSYLTAASGLWAALKNALAQELETAFEQFAN